MIITYLLLISNFNCDIFLQIAVAALCVLLTKTEVIDGQKTITERNGAITAPIANGEISTPGANLENTASTKIFTYTPKEKTWTVSMQPETEYSSEEATSEEYTDKYTDTDDDEAIDRI